MTIMEKIPIGMIEGFRMSGVLTQFSVACDLEFLLPFGLQWHPATSCLSAVIRLSPLPSHTLLCYQKHLSSFVYCQLDSAPCQLSPPKSSMLWLSSSLDISSSPPTGSIWLPELDLCQFLSSSLTQMVHICIKTICPPPFMTMANPAVLVLSSPHLSDLQFSLFPHPIIVPLHSLLFWTASSHDHYTLVYIPHMPSISIFLCLSFLLCSSLSL